MNEPTIASTQVQIEKKSPRGALNRTLPSQPPRSAPTTPRRRVMSHPPPCRPGMRSLAIAPAIRPRIRNAMNPMRVLLRCEALRASLSGGHERIPHGIARREGLGVSGIVVMRMQCAPIPGAHSPGGEVLRDALLRGLLDQRQTAADGLLDALFDAALTQAVAVEVARACIDAERQGE